ncbi:MAG: GNAT family N-acetyltransferase [Chloroflexi bacterium]|nr:GNAT family N-acetyltransferase [Chloroflexota bacterium]
MTATEQLVDTIGPARLRLCRDLEAEIPTLWAVQDAARVADSEIDRNSLAGFATYYRHLERCDPTRDLVVAEVDGTVVGYARVEWNDSNDGERWYEGMGNVHPDWRRRGIGTQLLAWTEARRAEIAAEHEAAGEATDRVRAVTTFVLDGDRGGAILLERRGYTAFRWFASMRRPDLDDLPEVELPEGFDIRPIARDRVAMRQVFDADVEAFRDHFGWTEGSDEKFEEFLEDPDVDTSLWIVAFAGDEVAGGVLNGIHVNADGEAAGWLDSVFTRRPWRKKGLARALIARSLVVLRERGMTAASLGVDLANANQALALYESCGFRAISGATAYRKPLPARVAHRLEEAPR